MLTIDVDTVGLQYRIHIGKDCLTLDGNQLTVLEARRLASALEYAANVEEGVR